AVAVGALFEPPQRFVDLVQRLRLHLDQREFDLVLNIQLRALGRVEHALDGAARALRAHVAHPALDLTHDFAAALLEDALQLVVPNRVHRLPSLCRVMTAHMTPTPFHLRPTPTSQVGSLYA